MTNTPASAPQRALQAGEGAPGHTDLMVSPEGLAAYLDKPAAAPVVDGKPVFGEAAHLKFTMEHYARCKVRDRGSVLSGWGDAAHMCDAIAADIIREGTVRGKVRKDAHAAAAAVKRAGDAIWAMREMLP